MKEKHRPAVYLKIMSYWMLHQMKMHFPQCELIVQNGRHNYTTYLAEDH